MKKVIPIPAIVALVAFLLSLAFVMEIGEAAKVVDICGSVSRARLAVNLRDKDCLNQAENGTTENEHTDVVVREINMDLYAVCLLKKAGLVDGRRWQGAAQFRHPESPRTPLRETRQRSALGLALIARALQKCRRARGKDRYFKAANIVKCLLDNQGTTIRCAG
ncbi:hypothetical protein TKK_0007157 [Trichogramma kaykai]